MDDIRICLHRNSFCQSFMPMQLDVGYLVPVLGAKGKRFPLLGGGKGLAAMRTEMDRGRKGFSC